MNFTISILDINIDQSQQSFLRTVGVLAKTAVPEFVCFTPQPMIMTVMMIVQDPRNIVFFIHLWYYVRIPKLF